MHTATKLLSASYDKAIAIKPESPETWINRGIALTSLQRYQDAIASYNQSDRHQTGQG